MSLQVDDDELRGILMHLHAVIFNSWGFQDLQSFTEFMRAVVKGTICALIVVAESQNWESAKEECWELATPDGHFHTLHPTRECTVENMQQC